MTSKELILKRLAESHVPVAIHELEIIGHSENALASRLSELQREGKVVGMVRKGKRFKEWALKTIRWNEKERQYEFI